MADFIKEGTEKQDQEQEYWYWPESWSRTRVVLLSQSLKFQESHVAIHLLIFPDTLKLRFPTLGSALDQLSILFLQFRSIQQSTLILCRIDAHWTLAFISVKLYILHKLRNKLRADFDPKSSAIVAFLYLKRLAENRGAFDTAKRSWEASGGIRWSFWGRQRWYQGSQRQEG